MEKELKKTTPRFDKFILGVGLVVGILGIVLTFITDIEIYRPLRFFSIIIYLVYWYRDKNYIGKKTKIYYNKKNSKRCSLVYNTAWELKDHLED